MVVEGHIEPRILTPEFSLRFAWCRLFWSASLSRSRNSPLVVSSRLRNSKRRRPWSSDLICTNCIGLVVKECHDGLFDVECMFMRNILGIATFSQSITIFLGIVIILQH